MARAWLLNQLRGAGIRNLAGLGEAGKRGWDLSWVSRCRRGSESPHPAWERFGSPHFHRSSRAGLGDGPLEGPAGFLVGARPCSSLGTNLWGWGPQSSVSRLELGEGEAPHPAFSSVTGAGYF